MSPGTWEPGPSRGLWLRGSAVAGVRSLPRHQQGPGGEGAEQVQPALASTWDWPLLLHPVQGSSHISHEKGKGTSVAGRAVVRSDVHALIPRTTEYVGFHGKGDFADMTK